MFLALSGNMHRICIAFLWEVHWQFFFFNKHFMDVPYQLRTKGEKPNNSFQKISSENF